MGAARSLVRRGGSGGGRSGPGVVLAVIILAVIIGLAIGWMLQPKRDDYSGKPDAPIEWNAVAAAPTRAPDAEDVAWEKRAEEADAPVVSSGAEAIQDGSSVRVTRGGAVQSAGNGIYVIDGDTFSLGGKRIRIAGMDAPETHPPRCMQEAQLGLAATQKLKELLSSGTVTMSGSGHDKYGRELRQVFVNGQDVADVMISADLARSYGGGKKQGWC